MCRFFIILFLIVSKGIYAPLLAEELYTQQKNQETKEFSGAQGSYKPPIIQGMLPPIPPPPISVAGCNSEIMKNLKKTYSDSEKELNSIIRYVGFGILIAIFFMGQSFGVRKKCLVLFSSSFAILSLFLNYLGCAYLLIKSGNMLRDANQNEFYWKYSEM